MIYIYVLIDPRNSQIRYVGKSIRPKDRLTNHCNDHSKNHRCYWIQELLSLGMMPKQQTIEIVPPNISWQEREIYWISYYKRCSANLVNCTDGGDGVLNLSGESKERMLKTWKGRKHKPESLIKIGLASKGRKHNDKWKKDMKQWIKKREFTKEYRDKLSIGVSKLDVNQINIIKSLLNDGVSQYVIADMFNVHQGTISHIKCGKFYKNVGNEVNV